MQQKIYKVEKLKTMKTQTYPSSSLMQRKARTRSLIQLGGLLEHAETLEVFNIPLGVDLQKDELVKNNIAALFKGLLILNEMIGSGELDLEVLALQGLQAFKERGLSETRPLDRKKYKEFEANSADKLEREIVNDYAQLSRAPADKIQEYSELKQEEKM